MSNEQLIASADTTLELSKNSDWKFKQEFMVDLVSRLTTALKEVEQKGYFLSDDVMSGCAVESFDKFLELTKHGAKFIDIRVRKDAQEYTFEGDFLKYMKKRG